MAERRLARDVRALMMQSERLDYEDPHAEAAHYRSARPIINAVVAARSRSIAGLRIKAEALVWCHGGEFLPPSEAPAADRLVGALVRDLLNRPGR